MVAQWIDDPGEHKRPTIPADSPIASALDAARSDPIAEPDRETLTAALTSGTVEEIYGAMQCLSVQQEHHPNLLDELDDELFSAFERSENVFVDEQFAELLERQAEIDGYVGFDAGDFGGFIQPGLPARFRLPILRLLAGSIERDSSQFMRISNEIQRSLESPYPAIQAASLEILQTAVEDNFLFDAVDYADELANAVYVDDETVQETALALLCVAFTDEPQVLRSVADRIFELLDSPSVDVRFWALQATYRIARFYHDLLEPVVPRLVSIASGDDPELTRRLHEEFSEAVAILQTIRPITNAMLFDEGVAEQIDTEALVSWFDPAYVGTGAGIEPQILFAELAPHDPAAVAELGPLLESALTTGETTRTEPLEDEAYLLGYLASSAPEAVTATIDSHVDALDDPDTSTSLLAWELGHIAIGAPEAVADALGVAGETEWPDDPLGDSNGATLCRGLLTTATPGYALPADDRSQAIAETAVETYLDDEAAGFWGDLLYRLAQVESQLLEPYDQQLASIAASGGYTRKRMIGCQTLVAIDAHEQLPGRETRCQLSISIFEQTLE